MFTTTRFFFFVVLTVAAIGCDLLPPAAPAAPVTPTKVAVVDAGPAVVVSIADAGALATTVDAGPKKTQ